MKNRYIKFRTKKFFVVVITLSVLLTSCEDFLEIETPRDQISSDDIFSTNQTAEAAMNGLYATINGNFSHILNTALERYTSIASDEAVSYYLDDNEIEIGANNISSENLSISQIWSESYKVLSLANAIIDGVQNNSSLSIDVRDRLLGEALFFRAFTHFHLVNLFGDIPYANTSDVATLNTLYRMPATNVYESIAEDLVNAKLLLPEDYSHSGGERIRANKYAAVALLSRVYLYMNDWENADIEASEVINSGLYNLESLNNVFIENTQEAILTLDNRNEPNGNSYGDTFVMYTDTFAFFPPGSIFIYGAYALNEDLLNDFEPNDNRYDSWAAEKTLGANTWYYCFKYKKSSLNSLSLGLPNEDFVLLRLAEQYLVRAEARAHLNNISGAQSDINIIRNRAGLGNTTASNQSTLLEAVMQERRIELMLEGGHRWYDLKRYGKADEVLTLLKPDWQSTDMLFPIPVQEIFNNGNLTQNPGY